MNGLGDPIPLGDEVSEGRLSEARDAPNFQCNTINHHRPRSPRHEMAVPVTGRSRSPSPILNPYPLEVTPANPNRVTGIELLVCLQYIFMANKNFLCD